jgi:hypothetical protein
MIIDNLTLVSLLIAAGVSGFLISSVVRRRKGRGQR